MRPKDQGTTTLASQVQVGVEIFNDTTNFVTCVYVYTYRSTQVP